MLLTITMDDPYRPTRDLDLLGFGDPDPDAMVSVFKEICSVSIDDAVGFDMASIAIDRIRYETDYGGLRVKTVATVDGARIGIAIDIGFGDAIEPGLVEIDLPVLLDQPAPHLRAYSYETVIAEKFQAMVQLGRANTRMKDFYDIWFLARSHKFEDDRLARAITATFARRATAVPAEIPDALTDTFAADPMKQKQWALFIRDVAAAPGPLPQVIAELAAFLMPHASACATSPATLKQLTAT